MDTNSEPQLFTVIRVHDAGGISGVGRVLDGVLFPNGKVVICWRVAYETIAVYESFAAFKAIHVDSHPTNQTQIIWNLNNATQYMSPTAKPKSSFFVLSKFFSSLNSII